VRIQPEEEALQNKIASQELAAAVSTAADRTGIHRLGKTLTVAQFWFGFENDLPKSGTQVDKTEASVPGLAVGAR